VKLLILRRAAVALFIGGLTAFPSACVAPGGGYAYSDGVGLGVDYYEPYGVGYGGWDSGYQVGPYRDGGHRGDRGGGGSAQHLYRSAPASRPMPSIPSGSRSGGSHAGGSHR
jgi:hypothetical protein